MIKRITLLIMLLVLCCLSAQHAAAQVQSRSQPRSTPQTQASEPQSQPQARQQSQPQPAQDESAEVSQDSADLAITAHVTARELRFETVPNPQVEFTGQPQRRTQWEAVRENLPRPVQPGVTYRDIGIRLKIVSVFADIDRIVAEALGEVPVKDQLPPDKNSQGQSSQVNHPAQSNTPVAPTSVENSPPQQQDRSQPAQPPSQTPAGQTGARPH